MPPARQQWNFSPPAAVHESENYSVRLFGVSTLELIITPNIGGPDHDFSVAIAISLTENYFRHSGIGTTRESVDRKPGESVA
ncbi:MAG: hypothetical protein JOZ10_14500 [Acidobacteria bacterium]|nr:hypothetical protein [Acidobacteriota bacterium]